MDKNENTAERQALKRLANAVADHLGIGTQSKHLKGFAYSEAVRKELHAAHAEADAAIRTTPPPAPVLSDAEIQEIWSAKNTPLQQSKLSAFGLDRIRAIEQAIRSAK